MGNTCKMQLEKCSQINTLSFQKSPNEIITQETQVSQGKHPDSQSVYLKKQQTIKLPLSEKNQSNEVKKLAVSKEKIQSIHHINSETKLKSIHDKNQNTKVEQVKKIEIDEEKFVQLALKQIQIKDGDEQARIIILENQQELLKSTKRPQQKKEKVKINVNWGSFIKLKKKNYADQYEVIQEIGKGGFGTVSKVRMKHSGVFRAMKSIKKSSLIKQDQQKIFVEMSILKHMDHPNIVKLHEIYDWKNYYYLITELCEGGELFDKIRKLKHFSEKNAAQIMKNILSPVIYMHKQNIVHRDLKPQNLLFAEKQGEGTLKIIDFGTSKKIEKGKKLSKQIGTAYYIAPEVLGKCYDTKCDVWSCGVILYILLCGYPPFRGPTEKQILNNIKHGNLKFQSHSWKSISKEAIDLIKKMLVKNPDERITAHQAYNSNWIHMSHTEDPLQTTALNNLRDFHFQNRLKAVVLTYIASQLYSNKDKADLEKVFRELDEDGDGVIQRQQLIHAFEHHYRDNQNFDINGILKLIDTNNSGKIDFTQFLVAASSEEKLYNQKRIDTAFEYFDVHHRGFITIDDIKMFLNDDQDTNQSIAKLFKEVDIDGNGQISKQQFKILLLNHSS